MEKSPLQTALAQPAELYDWWLKNCTCAIALLAGTTAAMMRSLFPTESEHKEK